MSDGMFAGCLIFAGCVAALAAYGLSCDLRSWLWDRKVAKLRAAYEQVDERELERRAIEGACNWIQLMLDQLNEIKALPEAPDPQWRLS